MYCTLDQTDRLSFGDLVIVSEKKTNVSNYKLKLKYAILSIKKIAVSFA